MLPKLPYPIHDIKVPSLDKVYKFRPFLVKEEKILLMAKESEEATDILIAIKQIITNCSLEENLDIDELCIFDLEYIFLKLRALSVDNMIKVSYIDNEDDKVYDFEINLDDVEVVFPEEEVDNTIKIDENSGLVLNYPSASLYSDNDFLYSGSDHMFNLIVRCVSKIYNGDEVFEATDLQIEEIENFLDSLDLKTFNKIIDFLSNTPKIEHELSYINSLDKPRKIILRSLNDFFAWR